MVQVIATRVEAIAIRIEKAHGRLCTCAESVSFPVE